VPGRFDVLRRRTPHFFTDSRNRTYPNGYRIGELGPPRLVAAERRGGSERTRPTEQETTRPTLPAQETTRPTEPAAAPAQETR